MKFRSRGLLDFLMQNLRFEAVKPEFLVLHCSFFLRIKHFDQSKSFSMFENFLMNCWESLPLNF